MKIIINEQQLRKIINETFEYANKIIISVDVQESYTNNIHFNLYEYGDFITQAVNNGCTVLMLYNGENVGYCNQNEYMNWLYEYCNIDEEILYNLYFYDKGYGFFRDMMESSFNYDSIIKLVNFMISNNIHDSRDIDEDTYNVFIQKYQTNDISFEDLEYYPIFIPDVYEELDKYNNVYLCGGSDDNQCLTEIEILLDGMNKQYNRIEKFIYS